MDKFPERRIFNPSIDQRRIESRESRISLRIGRSVQTYHTSEGVRNNGQIRRKGMR